MRGNEVFKVAVKTLERIAMDSLKEANMTADDIDWFIPHQANIRIIQAVSKRLNISEDKVVISLTNHGNTSAASIPLALDQSIREGKIKNGDTVLLQSFGAGFTWGTVILEI